MIKRDYFNNTSLNELIVLFLHVVLYPKTKTEKHTMDKNSSEDKGSNHSNEVPYTCKMQLLTDQDVVLLHLAILQHNAVE